METEDIRRIREKLEMDRIEFGELLCLSSYNAVMNIETGFRRPGKFTVKFLRYLDALPKTKAKALAEELKKYDCK